MKKEWFEAWFDSPYYHVLYKGRDDEEAKSSLDKLLSALDLQPGARLLDLACGKGRHARYLAEKGYFVTGLDISESSIAFARQFETNNLEFYQQDMRMPFRSNYFDGMLNMFTSFGYFKSDREHLLALQNMTSNLKPGGQFLLDYFNSQWIRGNVVANTTQQVEEITFQMQKQIVNNTVVKTITFEADQQVYSFTEAVRLFELPDFQALFAQCGMTINKIFGDYDLSKFDPKHSRRLILVAEKNA